MKIQLTVSRAAMLGEIAWIQGLLISGNPDSLQADYLRKRHSLLTGALLDDGQRFFRHYTTGLARFARACAAGEVYRESAATAGPGEESGREVPQG